MGYLILYKIIWIRYEQNYIPFGIELTNQIFKPACQGRSSGRSASDIWSSNRLPVALPN